ncbi:hypothetical protein EWM64_g76 [Hericium alpestre]|uniref:Elongation factor EFG domain-containing protein n=1 Tax=Hericium alpestre TaxID=135208 RepID=A0A4Z0AAZ1_9AGAM|nr:hypothetical protein EWM64_g76 [Hericium alpestre]
MLSLLSHRLHPTPLAITLPVASLNPSDYTRAEPGIAGLIDLVKWEFWKQEPDGSSSRHALPTDIDGDAVTGILPADHLLATHLIPARTAIIESLAMYSDELMEKLLEMPSTPSAYAAIPGSMIMPHLREATLRAKVLPVLCGSAINHVGTEILMDYAGELLASPLDVVHEKQMSKPPVRLLAWKVAWDKKKGWMTFVRVYSGTLTRQSVLLNSTRNTKERVSKLLLLYASDVQEVDELPFGSVGVILGLKHTRTGDTLVSTNAPASVSNDVATITPPSAVMSASVVPQSHADLAPVEEALHALSRTDPSVRVETQEGQLLVHGLGALHLEIVEGRLKDEWGVRFEFGKRQVSYRESVSPIQPGADVDDTWSAMVSGQSVSARVSLSLRPLEDEEIADPAWEGNIVLDPDNKPLPAADGSQSSQEPLSHIARGVASALSASPHTSLPLSRLHIAVSSFQCPTDAPPSILAGASTVILRNRLKARPPGPLMEPFIRLRISVGDDAIGKVVKDLTEHGGEVLDLASANASADGDDVQAYSQDGLYIPPAWLSPSTADTSGGGANASLHRRTIHALAPLSQMLDYSTRLRALSGGHGQFEMANAGFRIVGEGRRLEILRAIGRA